MAQVPVVSGTGTLHMNNATSQVAFTVNVTRGGPGAGTLQLTVNGPPVGLFPLAVGIRPSGIDRPQTDQGLEGRMDSGLEA